MNESLAREARAAALNLTLTRAADNVTDLAQIFDHFSAVLNNSTLFVPSTPPVPQIIVDTVRQAAPSARTRRDPLRCSRHSGSCTAPCLRRASSSLGCMCQGAWLHAVSGHGAADL